MNLFGSNEQAKIAKLPRTRFVSTTCRDVTAARIRRRGREAHGSQPCLDPFTRAVSARGPGRDRLQGEVTLADLDQWGRLRRFNLQPVTLSDTFEGGRKLWVHRFKRRRLIRYGRGQGRTAHSATLGVVVIDASDRNIRARA